MKISPEIDIYTLNSSNTKLANDALTDQITGSEAEGAPYKPSTEGRHPITQDTIARLGKITNTPPTEPFETRSMPEIYAAKNTDPSLLG